MSSINRRDLELVFRHFAGSDGDLDRREFANVLQYLGLPSNRRFINMLLVDVDGDGSGTLNMDEFCSIFLPSTESEDDFDEDEARMVFDLFSRGDGELQLGELRRALCSLGIRFTSSQARQLLRQVDADGSGTLDYAEYIALMKQLSRQQAAERPPEQQQQPASMYGQDTYSTGGRKEISKALFIGINYTGTDAELKGCVNDVRLIRNTIQKTLGIPIREERVLVEDPSFKGVTGAPTVAGITEGMKWLSQGAKPGDSLFFHYSGHGGSVKERIRGSEASGQDQCIFPIDFQQRGVIIDNDINAMLIAPLPPGVRLTAIFDCCHSGSIMDLPFAADPDTSSVERHSDQSIPSSVTMFAGCRDDQTSADAYQGEGMWGGALTYSLSNVLSEGKSDSVGKLLQRMRAVLAGKYTQIPQLSSSHSFDLGGNFSLFGASTEEL